MVAHPECALCALDPPDGVSVIGIGSWALSIPSGLAPWAGWVTIHPLVHRSSPDELDVAETSELGHLLVSASRFLRERTGATRIYVANWAEATPHVHFHLIPRPADLPEERLAAKVFTLMGGPRDSWPPLTDQLVVLGDLAAYLGGTSR